MFGSILSAVFGKNGIAGTIVGILQDTGLLKDPAEQEKAREALLTFELKARDQEVNQIAAINATMQAEAKSEHFLVYSWRPMFGYTCAGIILNNYALVVWFKIPSIPIPDSVFNVMLAVLGVSALTRGVEKIVKTGSIHIGGNG